MAVISARMVTALVACAMASGCSTMVTYEPRVTDAAQSLKYTQGVGTLSVRGEEHELFMYPTFKMQGVRQPTFTLGYANNEAASVDFSPANVRAYFRGSPVPIYTYSEKVDEIQTDKKTKQLALAILGGVAAGAAAYAASHQTYTSRYSATYRGPSGRVSNFTGTSTLRVYDPASGILAGAAVGGATGLGIQQLEYNARTQELAADEILQANTVEPRRMVSGNIILRNCCDQFARADDVLRFEVTANAKTRVFEFVRVSPGARVAPAATPFVARTAPAPVVPAVVVPVVATPDLVAVAQRESRAVPENVPTVAAGVARVAAPVPVVVKPAVSADLVPQQPPAKFAGLAGGQDAFNAEKTARGLTCTASPSASLTAKGPGYETYNVACDGGDSLVIRCEMGSCRPLR